MPISVKQESSWETQKSWKKAWKDLSWRGCRCSYRRCADVPLKIQGTLCRDSAGSCGDLVSAVVIFDRLIGVVCDSSQEGAIVRG